MTSALLLRLAIPLLLALVSTAALMRLPILLGITVAFVGLVFLLSRLSRSMANQREKKEGKFIESSYKIVDDDDEPRGKTS